MFLWLLPASRLSTPSSSRQHKDHNRVAVSISEGFSASCIPHLLCCSAMRGFLCRSS